MSTAVRSLAALLDADFRKRESKSRWTVEVWKWANDEGTVRA